MTIVRGTKAIRRHGKNYIGTQANSRLQEAVRPYQEIGLNALNVDTFDVQYFKLAKSSQVCTCKQIAITGVNFGGGSASDLSPVLGNPNSSIEGSVRIDYNRPLFGYATQPQLSNQDEAGDELSIDDVEEQERGIKTVDQVFSSSAECGICYKQGFQPGYLLYGQDRRVLTTVAVKEAYGYSINESTAPSSFEKIDEKGGYVEFEVEVPKFFQKVTFSVRNNVLVIPGEVLYTTTGDLLTFSYLKQYAGQVCTVVVKAEKFTHAVLTFDVGSEPIKASLAQGTKTLDWTMFDTFGTIQIVLPPTIQEVTIADVIYVPTRNMSFKVTDINFLRTASDFNIDWQITVRILQPTESLRTIHNSVKLR